MAIEWGFLILLAVGAAVADLRPGYIILVMTIGWILVVLVELLAWRARPGYAVTETAGEVGPPVELAPAVALPPAQAAPAGPPAEPLPPVAPPPAEAAPGEPVLPPAPSYDFEFQRSAAPSAPEEETGVVGAPFTAGPEPAAALDPDDPYAPAPERDRLRENEQRVVYRLEPLKPRPQRKYRFFGPRERELAEPEKAPSEEGR